MQSEVIPAQRKCFNGDMINGQCIGNLAGDAHEIIRNLVRIDMDKILQDRK